LTLIAKGVTFHIRQLVGVIGGKQVVSWGSSDQQDIVIKVACMFANLTTNCFGGLVRLPVCFRLITALFIKKEKYNAPYKADKLLNKAFESSATLEK